MRTRDTTERSSFKCSKLGAAAAIVHTYNILPSGVRLPAQVNCNNRLECGIASQEEDGVRFDWSECVHPELRQPAAS